MRGKLIVIESGSDGSGKATQSQKLFNRLYDENYKVRKIEFPNYKSNSSALVKMYLNGEFGSNPEDVNAYAASTFYAVDRFASYKTEWEEFYKAGDIIIADRYTTSNMVHQASKINDEKKRDEFLEWISNLEYNLYKLPKPDCVIFLDMPPQYSNKLIENRINKFTGNEKKDIHEKNYEYLKRCYNNSLYIANRGNWNKIKCIEDNKIKTVDEIHDIIYSIVKKEVISV
ncbi:deoxynucleoside kinase [Clostridium tyrobutyricum]|jgi:dTMP kinase|uniref:Thymidylate kinase n=1 Tax=Clostridium tyrobutyricum DIVETGP TaxID=1408889 RepID=W6NE57_CLOTY|nr:deoxynucleoside kinase [Clostridium tyrobutyricum]AND83323.1 thymidylate kinase [Clostridium tyrobutyricum]ANP68129.1 thymidylate kinase [Clostridium tyrobutyricum]MBR9649322.1 deoxynucleoside kinase [Clostridium tyrobutyricum]MBV4423331.1 deoxynucleoside kinase [Clostridium tyrobutyricum]MBV4424568.1 deoxynucleoside kinase [Clostridium tyrobutyricum]